MLSPYAVGWFSPTITQVLVEWWWNILAAQGRDLGQYQGYVVADHDVSHGIQMGRLIVDHNGLGTALNSHHG
jgi:hypothetical protein